MDVRPELAGELNQEAYSRVLGFRRTTVEPCPVFARIAEGIRVAQQGRELRVHEQRETQSSQHRKRIAKIVF